MDIKQVTVVVGGKDVVLRRKERGLIQADIPGFRGADLKLEANNENWMVAARLIRLVTDLDWRVSHTNSMVSDLASLLCQVADI